MLHPDHAPTRVVVRAEPGPMIEFYPVEWDDDTSQTGRWAYARIVHDGELRRAQRERQRLRRR